MAHRILRNENSDEQGLFFTSFFIASGIAVYRLKALKETIANPNKLDLTLRGIIKLFKDAYLGSFGILSKITRELWILSILVAILIFSASLTSAFWVVRVTQVVGLSLQERANDNDDNWNRWGNCGYTNRPLSRSRTQKTGDREFHVSLGAALVLSFLGATTFYQVALIAVLSAVLDAFLNSSLRSLFADITPRSIRGRAMALVGGGGLHLLRGAFASSIFGKLFQTSGTLVSGYLYSFNDSLPWIILSVTMLMIRILVLVLVSEPEKPEI